MWSTGCHALFLMPFRLHFAKTFLPSSLFSDLSDQRIHAIVEFSMTVKIFIQSEALQQSLLSSGFLAFFEGMTSKTTWD